MAPETIRLDYMRLHRASRAMLSICNSLLLSQSPAPREIQELKASTEALKAVDAPLNSMFQRTVSVLQVQQRLLTLLATPQAGAPINVRLEIVQQCMYAAYALGTLVETWMLSVTNVLSAQRDQRVAHEVSAELDALIQSRRQNPGSDTLA